MPPQQPPYNPYPPQQPQPQTPQPAPQPASQYEFIMNPQAAKRRNFTPRSPKGLLFLVGAAALVVILLAVIFSALSGGKQSSAPYLRIAQEQQEMARVADLQSQSIQQERTNEFVKNTKLTMNTDQTALLAYLSKHGMKLSTKQIAQGVNSATDTKLGTAVSTSSLDSALTAELQQELTTYRASLRQAYGSTSNGSTRNLLQHLDHNAELLLTQSKQ